MKIGVLYTGGTLGCVTDVSGSLVPLSSDKFAAAFAQYMLPLIAGHYGVDAITLDVIPFENQNGQPTALDSTNLQPAHWCEMARQILEHYSAYDGFIVLHGTDTMAWTASALSFLFTGLDESGQINALLDKPVIVTGSQLPLFAGRIQEGIETVSGMRLDTDATRNICGAVAAVYAGVQEVGLFFNRKLLRGNRSIKSNASEFDAFTSPNYPPLAIAVSDFELEHSPVAQPIDPAIALSNNAARTRLQQQLSQINARINDAIVVPFPAFPAFCQAQSSVIADMLNHILQDARIKGLILESYGAGNFPSGNPAHPERGAIYQALRAAGSSGVVIVNCTQVRAGVVNANTYAAGSWVGEVGSVDSHDMIAVAALCKLTWLTALKECHGWDKDTLRRMMLKNVAGEVADC